MTQTVLGKIHMLSGNDTLKLDYVQRFGDQFLPDSLTFLFVAIS